MCRVDYYYGYLKFNFREMMNVLEMDCEMDTYNLYLKGSENFFFLIDVFTILGNKNATFSCFLREGGKIVFALRISPL